MRTLPDCLKLVGPLLLAISHMRAETTEESKHGSFSTSSQVYFAVELPAIVCSSADIIFFYESSMVLPCWEAVVSRHYVLSFE
jgi:hypothetical protein